METLREQIVRSPVLGSGSNVDLEDDHKRNVNCMLIEAIDEVPSFPVERPCAIYRTLIYSYPCAESLRKVKVGEVL